MYFRGQRKSAQDVSLSDYIETGADGAALELQDVLGKDDDLLDRVFSRQQLQQIRRAISECLTDQEQRVIRMRYGLGCSPSRQREVAQKIGLSRSYVSRIEKRALEKLKAAMSGE